MVFGLFIASNAIIASVAVWNLSLLQAMSMNFPVVSYLIFLGAFGLAVIFTIIFVELAWRNTYTSRVVFECAWVTLFFVLNLAGVAAYSAIVPSSMCSKKVERRVVDGSCVSTQVLQGFTGALTIILFAYLLLLLVSCFVRRQHGSAVWQGTVSELHSLTARSPIPSSPSAPRFLSKHTPLFAPKPRHPPPLDLMYSYRSGLSPDYHIEHFHPPEPPQPVASSSSTQPRGPGPISVPAFYPQAVQSSLIKQPLPVHQSARQQPTTSPSPPPLGNWPRKDIIQQPVRSRKLPVTNAEASEAADTSPTSPTQRRRPSGPRGHSEDRRPPPLDLSKISSFRDRDPV